MEKTNSVPHVKTLSEKLAFLPDQTNYLGFVKQLLQEMENKF